MILFTIKGTIDQAVKDLGEFLKDLSGYNSLKSAFSGVDTHSGEEFSWLQRGDRLIEGIPILGKPMILLM